MNKKIKKEIERIIKEENNLKYNKRYLYAYRNHDKLGRGMVKPIKYQKGIYYKDWHCDTNPDNKNSFGFGIYPAGNMPVRVKIKDWGVETNREGGKGRVWGFEII